MEKMKQVTQESKEIYDLMLMFEKTLKTNSIYVSDMKRDTSGIKGQWYQNGTTNALFVMYISGYNLAVMDANMENQVNNY